MCLPLPENDTSILSLLTDLAELKQEAIRLREKPDCVLCIEGEKLCWYHRSTSISCTAVCGP